MYIGKKTVRIINNRNNEVWESSNVCTSEEAIREACRLLRKAYEWADEAEGFDFEVSLIETKA